MSSAGIPEVLREGNTVKVTIKEGSSLIGVVSGLQIPVHDYISVAYPSSDTEVYTFKTGGSGGTTVATLTVEYTDSTKENLSSVART